jgi:protein-tyrosine kinase
MSIFAKALGRLKDKPSNTDQNFDQAGKVREPVELPISDLDGGNVVESSAAAPDNVDFVDSEMMDLSSIDIESLDFDLSAEASVSTEFAAANHLTLNLARPFSHPVDLDLQKLDAKGFLVPTNANTPLSNTYRMIKRPLVNNASGKGATKVKGANLIMVTSSFKGEGKSYSAVNLAMSIAMEKNLRVLLIDADVNKPSHHNIFGVSPDFGMTDFLSGKVKDMSRIMYSTNIPSLSLMFAGSLTTHATELLASEAMEQFVQDLSERYPDRIIIFDSPPLLMTTEASVLASHMGQIILVVEAERTLRNDVKKSLNMLSNEIVLLLLNKVREKDDGASYGYYGYGHQG